jgi:4-amino-4-deoxy-L-arabinose transferase-like glycosyltransferase
VTTARASATRIRLRTIQKYVGYIFRLTEKHTRRIFLMPHRIGAVLLAILVTAAGIVWNSQTAGGADAYGYVSQAALWRAGSLHVDHRFALDAPWPAPLWTFTPLGYRPATNGTDIVPSYSPGLPMLMAAAQAVAGHCAAFWVVPILAGVLVLATYGIGVRLGHPIAGLAAAALVATSPTLLFMLMAPMSDVPVTAFWALAVLAVLGRSTSSSVAAGLAASIAILIRPNLVPLAAVPAIWIAWRDRRWRRVAAFIAGVVPAIVAVALINNSLYGSPVTSGYESLWQLFKWDHLWPNLRRYTAWLTTVEPVLAIAGLAGLAFLMRRAWPSETVRQAAALFVPFVIVAWAQYFPYTVFDDWWYLRFLLPAWPLLAIGAAAAGAAGVTSERVRRIAAIVLIAVCVAGVMHAKSRYVFTVGQGESKYTEVASAVALIVPPDGVVLSMQHSGSLRYYAGRMTLRWDYLDPEWLDRAVSWLAAKGHRPFVLVERFERQAIRRQFGGSGVGRLDWQPLATFRDGNILLYDAMRRDNQQPPATVAERERVRCVPPAVMRPFSW